MAAAGHGDCRHGRSRGPEAGRGVAERPRRVFSLIEREGIDCEATRNGTLHLAHSSKGLADIEERCRQGNRDGAPLGLLDAAETARRTGTPVYRGALLDPRAGTIQPLAYCRGLAQAAQKRGANIHERSPVTAIVRAGDLWVAAANGHQVRARSLLIATNAYQLGIETPFKPQYTAVSYCQFATAPLPEAARREILAGGEGCWDTALVMSSFRVDPIPSTRSGARLKPGPRKSNNHDVETNARPQPRGTVAGGSRQAYDRAAPVLSAMGTPHHLGPAGARSSPTRSSPR